MPIPVRPSPAVGALASSSQDPNCRKLMAADPVVVVVVGTPEDVELDTSCVVVFGALGRPRPWAAASLVIRNEVARAAPIRGRVRNFTESLLQILLAPASSAWSTSWARVGASPSTASLPVRARDRRRSSPSAGQRT